MQEIFYYLESLMNLKDLEIDAETGKQVIDLYCDILHNVAEIKGYARQSKLHVTIKSRISSYQDQINKLDDGASVQRFQDVMIQNGFCQ